LGNADALGVLLGRRLVPPFGTKMFTDDAATGDAVDAAEQFRPIGQNAPRYAVIGFHRGLV
jgi:hypothetical protein